MMKVVNYIDNVDVQFQILEFIKLQIVIIKIANIALQNSYIHNMMEIYKK